MRPLHDVNKKNSAFPQSFKKEIKKMKKMLSVCITLFWKNVTKKSSDYMKNISVCFLSSSVTRNNSSEDFFDDSAFKVAF